MDELRAVIQQYAERNTLRLCRKGKLVTRPNGSSYRAACRNKWSCPLCSPRWLSEYQERIEPLLQSVPTVVYVTFTVAHEPGPPQAGSLDSILKTWSAAFSTGSWMTDFRNRSGLTGWVRTIEATFPEGGFHPHVHAAFLFASQRHGDPVEALIQRWLASEPSGQASVRPTRRRRATTWSMGRIGRRSRSISASRTPSGNRGREKVALLGTCSTTSLRRVMPMTSACCWASTKPSRARGSSPLRVDSGISSPEWFVSRNIRSEVALDSRNECRGNPANLCSAQATFRVRGKILRGIEKPPGSRPRVAPCKKRGTLSSHEQ